MTLRRGAAGAGLLGAAIVAAWLFAGHHRDAAKMSSRPDDVPQPALEAVVHPNVAPVAVSNPVPLPWKVTPGNSPPLPAGQVPAWVVGPPAPDPNMHMPPAPVMPPDPETSAPEIAQAR